MKNQYFKELARGSFLLSISQFYQILLSGVLNILLARLLGVEMIGIYLASQAMIGLIYTFTQLGVQVPAKRETSRDNNQFNSYFGSALAIRLSITLPLTLLLALLFGNIFKIAPLEIVLLISLIMVIAGLSGLLGAAIQALRQFEAYTKVTIFGQTVYFILTVVALLITKNIIFVLMVMIVSQTFIYICYHFSLRKIGYKLHTYWKPFLWKSIIVESIPVVLAGSTEFINLRFDTFLIGIFLDTESAGIYGVAYSLYLVAAIMAHIVSVGAFPTLARYSGSHDLKLYGKFVAKLHIPIGFYGISLAVIGLLSSSIIVSLLYGAEFYESQSPLRILMLALPFITLNRFMIQVLNASGLQNGLSSHVLRRII